MKVNEIIRSIMETKEIKPTVLAYQLGINKNTMSERLNQENMSTDRMIEMLRVMGYKLVVVPIGERLPKGSIEIEHSPAKPKEKRQKAAVSDKE